MLASGGKLSITLNTRSSNDTKKTTDRFYRPGTLSPSRIDFEFNYESRMQKADCMSTKSAKLNGGARVIQMGRQISNHRWKELKILQAARHRGKDKRRYASPLGRHRPFGAELLASMATNN